MKRKAIALVLLIAMGLSVTGCEMILSMLGYGLVKVTNNGSFGQRVTIGGDKGGTQSSKLAPGASDVFLVGTSSSYAVAVVNDQLWIEEAQRQAAQLGPLVLRPLEMTDAQWKNLQAQLSRLEVGIMNAALVPNDQRSCRGTLSEEERTATVSVFNDYVTCN
jgi:hypothetical protein